MRRKMTNRQAVKKQVESSVGQDLIAAVKEAIHQTRTENAEPYRDNHITENVRIRRFSEHVRDDDLVWHRDERDRTITVLEGRGWQFQRDNELPQEMRPGQVIEVRAGEWHRVIKGRDELALTIEESGASMVSEDIVSIRRDGKDVLYDIEFDEGDRIVDYDPAPQNPESLLASESEQQAFEIVKRMTSVPDAQIIKTIQGLSAKDQVRKPWPGIEEGLRLMNASPEALETINWNPGKGIGRGEAALHLMFDTNPVVPEPDVVMRSGDGYSIKFFGSNGAGSVKAGEADPGVERAVSAVMSDLTQMSNSWDSDINILLAPKSGPSTVSLRDFLGSSLSNAEASDRVADFKRDLLDLRGKVIDLLESIASEHDAEGIIAVTDQFSFVPAGNAEDLIELLYLRGSKRPQIGLGRPGKTRTNWLSVIDDTLKEA